jgi:hypothetical protein
VLDNGCFKEYDEDQTSPIIDLSTTSPQNDHEAQFTYAFEDIDALSDTLGILWEKDKDRPFATLTVFVGFAWDLTTLHVSLPVEKRAEIQSGYTKMGQIPKWHACTEQSRKTSWKINSCKPDPAIWVAIPHKPRGLSWCFP